MKRGKNLEKKNVLDLLKRYLYQIEDIENFEDAEPETLQEIQDLRNAIEWVKKQ